MISLFKVFMSEDIKENINETLMSGYITQGKKVDEFERLLKNYCMKIFDSTTHPTLTGNWKTEKKIFKSSLNDSFDSIPESLYVFLDDSGNPKDFTSFSKSSVTSINKDFFDSFLALILKLARIGSKLEFDTASFIGSESDA